MEWLRLDVGFLKHPKVGAFSRGIGVKKDAAAVAILRLLCWAATTCEDGDLSRVHPDDVAEATELRADPKRVVEALVVSGWLDRDGERLTIHGWEERQSPLLAGRERVRRFRERRREERAGDAGGNVTRNAECEAAITDTRNVTRNATGNVTETFPVTDAKRYGNGPLPTDLPTNLEKQLSPLLQPSPVRGAKAGADAPKVMASGADAHGPGFVDFRKLSDAELQREWFESAKATSANPDDDAARRRYYALNYERLRRSPDGEKRRDELKAEIRRDAYAAERRKRERAELAVEVASEMGGESAGLDADAANDAPEGPAEARDAAGAPDDSAEARGGLTAPQSRQTRAAAGAPESALAAVEGA